MFEAVFFDLDGTLVDTAQDFERAINGLLRAEKLPTVAYERIRNQVSNGARALTALAFGLTPDDAGFDARLAQLLDAYENAISAQSQLFEGMDQVLASLRQQGIPWGVVTNKPERFTTPIMAALGLDDACAIICPDHVKARKPDPEGLLLAAAKAGAKPARCLYVGDHERDIAAGRNAGMATAAACYGYIEAGDDPANWQADFSLDSALDLLPLIQPPSSRTWEPA